MFANLTSKLDHHSSCQGQSAAGLVLLERALGLLSWHDGLLRNNACMIEHRAERLKCGCAYTNSNEIRQIMQCIVLSLTRPPYAKIYQA